MKRLPIIINVFLFAGLCMVISFWGMQIFKPKMRPIAAPNSTVSYESVLGQWGRVFGQSVVAESAPNSYQLKGVIVAFNPADSAAIIVAEGKPTFTIGIGKEIAPGVKLQEVHKDHIVISEAGIPKNIDLPAAPVLQGIVSALPVTVSTPSPTLPPKPLAPPSRTKHPPRT